mmetsp:Transcript_20093/g.36444  ORF Transcript_20093/g.36444 Transcript_20093/m.36444 type:complete len:226 (+) Transcript_20093:2914-3591(+)
MPKLAAFNNRFCISISNSRVAASVQVSTASSNMPVLVIARASSSDAGDPASKESDASKSMADGSMDPMRKSMAVAGGTRWRSSTAESVMTRQQSISGIIYRFSTLTYGNLSQSPYGPTINTPRFFQCKTTLSSPHHFMSNGGEEEPSDVSKSKTLVSNDVEMTVKMDDCLKHARNLPFGAKVIATIGDDMRARQSTSVMSPVTVLTTTTELSEVERKTSGCLDVV